MQIQAQFMFVILKKDTSINVKKKKVEHCHSNHMEVGWSKGKKSSPCFFFWQEGDNTVWLKWNSYTSNICRHYSPWKSHTFYKYGVMFLCNRDLKKYSADTAQLHNFKLCRFNTYLFNKQVQCEWDRPYWTGLTFNTLEIY